MNKNLIIFLNFILLFSVKSYSNEFIHIYFTPINLENLKNYQITLFKKYYNGFYENKKEYIKKSKENSIFLIEIYNKRNLNSIYYYLIRNLYFDYANFKDKNFFKDWEEQILKPKKEKLICFDCLEKNSYLYNKLNTTFFLKHKISIAYFNDCKFSDEEFKKLLYIKEDTNIWIFALNTNCLDRFNFDYLNISNAYFIFFIKNTNKIFYKKDNIYICKVNNEICYLKLKLREGTLLNLENYFIKIYK